MPTRQVKAYPAHKRKPPRPYQPPAIKAYNFTIDFDACDQEDAETTEYLRVIVPKKTKLPAVNVLYGWEANVMSLRLVSPKDNVKMFVNSNPLPNGISLVKEYNKGREPPTQASDL